MKGLGGGASDLGGMRMRKTNKSGCAAAAALSRSESVAMTGSVVIGGEDAAASIIADDAAAATGTEDAMLNDDVVDDEDRPLDLTLASTALMATFAFAFFAAAEPSSAADLAQMGGDHAEGAHELWSVAGSEVPFWANMVKYARFSISIMVGFAFMFGRPVVNLLKKPQTAILVLGGGYGGYRFFKFTIETMLGMNDPSTLNYEMHY